MEAKRILPLLGGTASVWTVCLLFFQCALFLGYAYGATASRAVHTVVLVLAAIAAWKAPVTTFDHLYSAHQGPWVVAVWLGLLTGLPFVAIAAGSVLLQRWAGTYRLYAVSNAGSLAALIAYPLVFEPLLDLDGQRSWWLAGGAVYAGLMLVCAWHARTMDAPARWKSRPGAASLGKWMLFAACGTGLLAAATNQICQEVASLPFLWVAPLALYLVSFILTFDTGGRWWTRPSIWNLAAAVAIPVAVILYVLGPQVGFVWHLAVDLGVLFVCLMVCHGQLAASRPPAEALGWFYLALSAGGVLGTLFPALLAPLWFASYAEFPLLLSAIALLALLSLPRPLLPLTMVRRLELFGLALAVVAPVAVLTPPAVPPLYQSRSFYGVLRVTERQEPQGTLRVLTHGQTVHGTQWREHPEWPTTYYTEASGVARAIVDEQRLRADGIRAGVVGLGAGTLAHYARPQDTFHFYELDPEVLRVALEYFRYLRLSDKTAVAPGDARQSLAHDDLPGAYDVLVVDAFSSDSIPVHLLTREAANVYRRRVKPEGSILFHISNRALNLEPVVRGLAQYLNRKAEIFRNEDQPSTGGSSAVWIRLRPGAYEGPRGVLWTDGYSSLWPLIRLR